MSLAWAAFALCVALSAFDLTFGWLSRDVRVIDELVSVGSSRT